MPIPRIPFQPSGKKVHGSAKSYPLTLSTLDVGFSMGVSHTRRRTPPINFHATGDQLHHRMSIQILTRAANEASHSAYSVSQCVYPGYIHKSQIEVASFPIKTPHWYCRNTKHPATHSSKHIHAHNDSCILITRTCTDNKSSGN